VISDGANVRRKFSILQDIDGNLCEIGGKEE
jgi:hypothetical protein